MAVHLSEIALAGLSRIAREQGREDLDLALAAAIKLHLGQNEPQNKSVELDGPPGWEQTRVYLFAMSRWRVLWSFDGDDVVVWSVKELSDYRQVP